MRSPRCESFAHVQAVQGKKGKQHVNPPAKLTNTPTAGRRLQATDAPAPAPEQGPAARRDMPPLPPMMPQGPQPGAMPAQGVRALPLSLCKHSVAKAQGAEREGQLQRVCAPAALRMAVA